MTWDLFRKFPTQPVKPFPVSGADLSVVCFEFLQTPPVRSWATRGPLTRGGGVYNANLFGTGPKDLLRTSEFEVNIIDPSCLDGFF
mmetsp:Transcript_20035/g.28781  ORF Transcript_20035/g.28781 Transcript_20035/m.28781 type:complete len:86 (+) Transcript_20035:368-625(+)